MQRRYTLTCDWVPDLDRPVVTEAGKLRAVGTEEDTKDHASAHSRVPTQDRRYFTRSGIVKSDVVVGITDCEGVAIWTEADTQYWCVTGQRRLTSRRLPNSHTFVPATTGYLPTIWTETNTPDFPAKSSIVSTHPTFENKQE